MPFTSRLSGASWTARLFVAVCGAVIVMELFWIAWILRFRHRPQRGLLDGSGAGAVVVTRSPPRDPQRGILEPGDVIWPSTRDVRAATIGPNGFVCPGWRRKPYRITVEQGGSRRGPPQCGFRRGPARARVSPLSRAGGSLFAATALFLSFQRWEDPSRGTGAFACLLPSLRSRAPGSSSPSLPSGERLLVAFTWYPHPFHLAVAFAFYRRFPPGVPSTKWLDAFEKILLGTFFAWWVLCSLWLQTRNAGPPLGPLLLDAFPLLDTLIAFDAYVTFLGFFAICGAIGRSYRLVTEEDQKRRLRWLTFGSLAGIGPWFLFTLASLVPGFGSSPALVTLNRVANIALVIVPITTGYAILKHRLFDIRMVLRSGLQYLLARNVLGRLPPAIAALLLPPTGAAARSKNPLRAGSRPRSSFSPFSAFAFRSRLTDALDSALLPRRVRRSSSSRSPRASRGRDLRRPRGSRERRSRGGIH
jgi:hypothetical protein